MLYYYCYLEIVLIEDRKQHGDCGSNPLFEAVYTSLGA
jgi:hypothetical protein